MREIDVQFATNDECPSETQIQHWALTALVQQKKNGALVIRVVDETEMTSLNYQFRKKNKPTNVLSFACQLPPSLKGDILGDIVICASVVAQEAKEQQKPIAAHWAHMVVHGVLHLLGHDHEKDDEATVMESEEVMILRELGFSDPYRVEHCDE
ncbi:MAG: rRNA maturation RNase YbeY [Gammaproteobacteria bacterium 39-13]|nr:rRNA maturation RNase YbeY [Gammaproteobacteria bacterium]OJV96479.1 MAG: rRNA maturation RNase YbeY [Gammaproteobacteria bacterium 39-13]